jgi:hypothetical protein
LLLFDPASYAPQSWQVIPRKKRRDRLNVCVHGSDTQLANVTTQSLSDYKPSEPETNQIRDLTLARSQVRQLDAYIGLGIALRQSRIPRSGVGFDAIVRGRLWQLRFYDTIVAISDISQDQVRQPSVIVPSAANASPPWLDAKATR